MSGVPFSDFGLRWFEDIIEKITEWFTRELTSGYEAVTQDLFGTPLPEGSGVGRVFSQPAESDELWHGVYEATVAGEMMIFGLIILFLAVQTRNFVNIFNVGSAYKRRNAKQSSWTGAFLIVTWYWVAVLSLYVVEGLTIGLLPNVAEVANGLLRILPEALNTPIITLSMAGIGGMSMLAVRALFFIREVLLYVFLYGMPIGLALAYGNIPVISPIAQRICSQFIALAILPLPAAMLFRGYAFLFTGETRLAVSSPFLEYLVVVSLPVLALYVTWKTFKYASPLAARAIGTAGRGTVLLGTVAGAAAVGGPKAAAVAGKWGPKAGASAALTNRYATNHTAPQPETPEADSEPEPGGRPEYRRKENDPAYY